MAKKVKILVAKIGLDGHDRGAKVVARALRDAGFEVIYTGIHQSPDMIITAALQEDVDAIGLSHLSGAHMTLFPKVLEQLKAKGRSDILVIGGGIIPEDDKQKLLSMGMAKIFGPGTLTQEIVDYLRNALGPGPINDR